MRPEFQNLVEQKLFVIMKGNFSALADKRIQTNHQKTIHPNKDPGKNFQQSSTIDAICFSWMNIIWYR
jgi:hypothetical protein